jgi:hypothetical protein
VLLTTRVALIIFIISCLVCSAGIFQSERSARQETGGANYCNPVESATVGAYIDSGSAGRKLQIVKILAIEETGPTPCVKIDLSLLNNDGEEVFVTRAAVQLINAWQILRTCPAGGGGGGGVPPTTNYNTTISLHSIPTTSYVDQVSQYLKAQDVDRFTITARLTNDPSQLKEGFLILEGRVKVYYNGAMETPWSKPFLFLSRPAPPQSLQYLFGEPAKHDGVNKFIGPQIDPFDENKATAADVSGLLVARTGLVKEVQKFFTSHIPSCLMALHGSHQIVFLTRTRARPEGRAARCGPDTSRFTPRACSQAGPLIAGPPSAAPRATINR